MWHAGIDLSWRTAVVALVDERSKRVGPRREGVSDHLVAMSADRQATEKRMRHRSSRKSRGPS
jgi:hypothetical protein